MKPLIFKMIIVLLVFAGIHNDAIQAESHDLRITEPLSATEFTKDINKEFSISADGNVDLGNKYGEVNVRTWTKNKVKIDVKITVQARSQSDADEIFNKIEIEFSNSANNVKAETNIESNSKSWWGGDNKSSYRIDYEVSMPKGCSLDLKNKYGHSNVAELDGKVTVLAQYGNFYLEGVNNDVNAILAYGEGTIVKAKDVDIDVKYSKITVKQASDVAVLSKYSKVYIDEADDVRSESKYDTYRLGDLRELNNDGKYDNFKINNIDLINTSTKYSDFEVQELSKEGTFNMEYGHMLIETVLAGFTSINITGKYTDFKVGVAKGANYALDVEAKYAGVKYPGDLDVTFEKSKNSEHFVKGTKGSSGGTIRARVEYGGVRVQ